MPSLLIPPSVHYGQLITDCVTPELAQEYLRLLQDYRHVLLPLHWKFRYGPIGKNNKSYYRLLLCELLEVETYIKELETKILTFKS